MVTICTIACNIKKICILLGAGTVCVCVCIPEIFKTDSRHFPVGLCNGNAVFLWGGNWVFCVASAGRVLTGPAFVCRRLVLFWCRTWQDLPPALQVGIRTAVRTITAIQTVPTVRICSTHLQIWDRLRFFAVLKLTYIRPRSHVPVFDRPTGSDYRRKK